MVRYQYLHTKRSNDTGMKILMHKKTPSYRYSYRYSGGCEKAFESSASSQTCQSLLVPVIMPVAGLKSTRTGTGRNNSGTYRYGTGTNYPGTKRNLHCGTFTVLVAYRYTGVKCSTSYEPESRVSS